MVKKAAAIGKPANSMANNKPAKQTPIACNKLTMIGVNLRELWTS